ncbi:MAG TPA: hypothetical protein PKA05_01360 [Roseiflexaceae bacterium]|nr:hypothetical protein [Roseiflexaceae bacterium]HMP39005.1 hypothetical protein [Roseiflexaceae bacterium]
MQRIQRRWIALGAVLPLIALVWFAPHAGRAGEAGVQPLTSHVQAGQTIEFQGIGFASGERIAIWATAPDQSVLGGEFAGANRAGEARIRFQVPRDALSGTWAITAFGERSRIPVIAEFQVSGREAESAALIGVVQPAGGPAGTRFFFAATGFRSSEVVSYWITAPDTRIVGAFPSGAKAYRGRVDLNWVAPAGSPAGVYVMTIQGLNSGIARGIPFEIR